MIISGILVWKTFCCLSSRPPSPLTCLKISLLPHLLHFWDLEIPRLCWPLTTRSVEEEEFLRAASSFAEKKSFPIWSLCPSRGSGLGNIQGILVIRSSCVLYISHNYQINEYRPIAPRGNRVKFLWTSGHNTFFHQLKCNLHYIGSSANVFIK